MTGKKAIKVQEATNMGPVCAVHIMVASNGRECAYLVFSFSPAPVVKLTLCLLLHSFGIYVPGSKCTVR